MSRIGKKSVKIPDGVTVDIKGQDITVKGPKGELSLRLHPRTKITEESTDEGKQLVVSVLDDKQDKAIWGTMRALVANLVEGVTVGFTKKLELNGVGFRMNLQGSTLVMALGFSHEVRYELPKDVTATVEANVLTLTSSDAQSVGQTAAEIRSLKKPEPYKGKGFRYSDEFVRRKVGKAAKTD
ncbi:MAG: 50S ribosomal protein L6 [Patescibacteria group bacterium]|nr:50S ribosomal protein L6 [Patescibacteria group bacterium]